MLRGQQRSAHPSVFSKLRESSRQTDDLAVHVVDPPDLPTDKQHEPTLQKKYLPFSGTNDSALVSTQACPPGLCNTPQLLAEQTTPPTTPLLTRAEQTQLHVRVIALENLVIALLASATDHQLDCAREMATYIMPRAGATPHPLTTHAAAEILSLVERAVHFRGMPPKKGEAVGGSSVLTKNK